MIVEAAPMAGYTDQAFRRVLIKCGMRVVWTEMVSAAAIYFGQPKSMQKTRELLQFDRKRGIKTVVQLFGHDPRHFEAAVKFVCENYKFDEININMGCPANKILKNGEGCALAKNPELAAAIVKTCVRVSRVPVSVKMRLDNAAEIAKICEQSGARRLIVHGRFGVQGYSGTADWNAIAAVVKSVKIPVIANGDVKNLDDARRCLEITGAAGVMIGRGLIGKPWAVGCGGNAHTNQKFINKIIHYHTKQAKKCDHNPNEIKKHLVAYKKLTKRS